MALRQLALCVVAAAGFAAFQVSHAQPVRACPDGQAINQLWNGNLTRNGAAMTVDNMNYNAVLGVGSSTSFGFVASWNAANRPPTDLTCRARG